MRHNAHYHISGKGHLYQGRFYQGRFKSFPIQSLNPSCCPHGQYRVYRIGLIESMNHLLTVNSKQFATVPNAEHHSGMKAGLNPSCDDWILNKPCDLAGDRECDLYRSTIKRKRFNRFDPFDFSLSNSCDRSGDNSNSRQSLWRSNKPSWSRGETRPLCANTCAGSSMLPRRLRFKTSRNIKGLTTTIGYEQTRLHKLQA